MSAALIEVDNLGMRYPARGKAQGRPALQGAGLAVLAGEFVTILGHNGCGKSTLLKCIAGLLAPTDGRVRVAGREIGLLRGQARAEARMAMAMVFQQARLIGRRSVLANALTGTLGRHRNLATAIGFLPKGEAPHAMRCLARVGLTEFAHQRASTLSGGQAQRASIARALAQRPQALLADEPVASLDPEAASEVMRMLRRVATEEGLAVICVLHQPDLARRYADRVIGMRQGRILFDDPASAMSDQSVAALYEGTHLA
jgi:phosphonate transport system ATP-binding protein